MLGLGVQRASRSPHTGEGLGGLSDIPAAAFLMCQDVQGHGQLGQGGYGMVLDQSCQALQASCCAINLRLWRGRIAQPVVGQGVLQEQALQ